MQLKSGRFKRGNEVTRGRPTGAKPSRAGPCLKHASASSPCGVNVITLASLLEYVARANGRTPKCEVPDLDQLKVVVRVAALRGLEEARDEIWARATLGELVLVSAEAAAALEEYEQALADPDLTWFSVRSMMR